MSEIRACAFCGARFETSSKQRVHAAMGHSLYCSAECCDQEKKRRARLFWKSDAGKLYAANRYKNRRRVAS